MAPKKKQSSDGDTSHFESAREKEKAMKAPAKSGIYVQPTKKVSVADSGRTAKYTGKRKGTKKVVTKR